MEIVPDRWGLVPVPAGHSVIVQGLLHRVTQEVAEAAAALDMAAVLAVVWVTVQALAVVAVMAVAWFTVQALAVAEVMAAA